MWKYVQCNIQPCDAYTWLLDPCQLSEYGKLFTPSCFAQRIEARVGVRQEGPRAIKLYDTTFIQEHHLHMPVNQKENSCPRNTYAIIVNNGAKSMCDREYRARGKFPGVGGQ